MTFRARPVDRGRAPRDPNRRNFYMNIGFGLTVVAAVVILIVVGVATWYNEHLAPAGTVNGQTITKDEFTARAEIEVWRLQQQQGRVDAALAAGRITSAQAETRLQALQTQAENLAATVLERLIDGRLQSTLAVEEGVTVSSAQVDERIEEERTAKEERHAWLIAVEPEIDDDAEEPTAAQKAAAKEKAEDALAEIRGGKTFEEVATAVSTDPSAASGGDIGWIDEDASEETGIIEAMFALEVNGVTDVIESSNGSFLIGRITEIAPAVVDPAWFDKLTDAGLTVEGYRAVVESEVLRQALEDKIVAEASAPGLQREVSVLYIQAPNAEPAEDAVKTRHILFAPNDDPQAAEALAADDPAWSVAELAARKAYEELVEDPTKFDAMAREQSDESSAQGDDGTGGKLPYFDSTSSIDDAFAAAILVPDLEPGQLLEPFKSGFGWHVVQVMYFPPDADQMTKLRDRLLEGGDFEELVRDYSDGETAGSGGEVGWIARGQLDNRLVRAIFAAEVGGISEVVDIPDDGLYLYRVTKEEQRTPDEDQLAAIERSAFNNWYGEKKDAATITRDVLGT